MIEVTTIIKKLQKLNKEREIDERTFYNKNEAEMIKTNREYFTYRLLCTLNIDLKCNMCKYYNEAGKCCTSWNRGIVEKDTPRCCEFVLKEEG